MPTQRDNMTWERARIHVLASLRNGEEVLEMLKSQQPHILLADFTLPGISGIDFVRQVRRLYPQLKITVLSMHHEAHVFNSVLKEGVRVTC